MIRAIVYAVLITSIGACIAKADSHQLVWTAVVPFTDGIMPVGVADAAFPSRDACEAFAAARAAHMPDWVRGALGLPIDYPAEVGFECRPAGDPT